MLFPACISILFLLYLGEGKHFLLLLRQVLLTRLEQSWRIFFGYYRPKVGSMLRLVVFAQRRFSLAHEIRPLTPTI
jgi:hypothetical protein